MGRGFVKNRGVVKLVNDFLFHDFFQIRKVNDHPEFCIVAVGYGCPDYGNRQFITVSMHIFAFAVITVKGVTGFETKLLCNPDFAQYIFIRVQI